MISMDVISDHLLMLVIVCFYSISLTCAVSVIAMKTMLAVHLFYPVVTAVSWVLCAFFIHCILMLLPIVNTNSIILLPR